VIDLRSLVPACRYQDTLAIAPDGGVIACSRNASGEYNVWLHPMSGAAPRQLTHFTDHAVRSLAFSPDGTVLAFGADHHGDELQRLYLVPVTGGEPRALTPAGAQCLLTGPPFSPDGTRLAIACNDRDPAAQDVLIIDLVTHTTQRVEARPGMVIEPAGFAPDGKRLLIQGFRANTDTDLYLLEPDGELTCLTAHSREEQHFPGPWLPDGSGCYEITDAGLDHAVLVFHDLDLDHDLHHGLDLDHGPGAALTAPDWGVEHVALSADGGTLVWTRNEDGRSVPYARRRGVDLMVPAVPAGQIRATSVSGDGRYLAFLLDSATRPTEVCVADLHEGGFRYLTDSRPPALADATIVPIGPASVRYPTHDGRTISALLYRPPGDGRFPVVLSVHGGPEDQERPVYRYAGLYQYLLAAGIAVLAPNIRGSTGYGTAFQKLIHRDWGGGDLGDLEHAVRYLHGLDWVDPRRIAVFGGSFGGFAALSCLARLPRYWAAGVSVVGQSNLVTFARSVPATWRPLIRRWVGDPDDDAELLAERSPITYVDDIVAPLFVIQGARDRRVVQAESDQIVARLRARGVAVRYDVYPDEGHGFTKRENEIKAWSDVGSFLVERLRSLP
jgi:dipeptidyl aminopeptidase/acylaminoacyl peptidase